MDQKSIQNEDLKKFLEDQSGGLGQVEPPRAIIKDLVASRPKLALIYALGSVAGYLLSLAICAQCSVGFTPLAWATAQWLHRIPDPWCAMICGAVFGVAPFLASLALLSRFQHRYLLYRMTWMPLVMPMIGSVTMTAVSFDRDWTWHATWIAAAVMTPYLLEAATGMALRQMIWRHKPTI